METQVEVIEKLQHESTTLEQRAVALPVTTDQEAVAASDTVVELKKALNVFENFFKPIVDTAFAAHRTATSRRNLVCDPIKNAISNRSRTGLSDRVAKYQYDQQQKRERQEAAARAEAARLEKEKQDRLIRKAEKEEAKGNTEKAEAIIEKAEEVYVAPKPIAAPVKTKTSVTVTYDVEVLDIKKIPFNYLIVDESKLTRCKKADKTLEVPGIKFHPRAIGSTRSK